MPLRLSHCASKWKRWPSRTLSRLPEIKSRLSAETGLPQDMFDVRVIDDLLHKGDIFSLVFLREILGNGILLADKDFDRRAQFIEGYGLKYLKNQGLLREVLL